MTPVVDNGANVVAAVQARADADDCAGALEMAIPAMSAWPAQRVALGDLVDRCVAVLEAGRGPPAPRRSGSYADRSDRFIVGFDIGAPTGLRFDRRVLHGVADGFGLRIGANGVIGSCCGLAFEATGFVDLRLGGIVRLEPNLGIVADGNGVQPAFALAVQLDPRGPALVNLGFGITPFGIVPDLCVGLVF